MNNVCGLIWSTLYITKDKVKVKREQQRQ